MTYSTHLLLALATVPAAALREHIRNVLDRHAEQITNDLLAFQAQPATPTTTFDPERQLTERLRNGVDTAFEVGEEGVGGSV